MPEKCIICDLDLINDPSHGQDPTGNRTLHYDCRRCGKYEILLSLQINLPAYLSKDRQANDRQALARARAQLSHWVRTEFDNTQDDDFISGRSGSWRSVRLSDKQLIDNILAKPLPNIAEQANNYIRWIGDKSNFGRDQIPVNKYEILSIIGSSNCDEFELVSSHLRETKGYIEHKSAEGGGDNILRYVSLTFPGWEQYEELKRASVESNKAFMAMKFGDKELNKIFLNTFKPAVRMTGFDLFKLDERPVAGLIDDRMRVEIRTSRFLVADLTHGNLGAYWEAGYAEGLGKHVIYTCKKSIFEDERKKPHFDTNHHLTILWDSQCPEVAAEQLKDTIRATLPGEAKMSDE